MELAVLDDQRQKGSITVKSDALDLTVLEAIQVAVNEISVIAISIADRDVVRTGKDLSVKVGVDDDFTTNWAKDCKSLAEVWESVCLLVETNLKDSSAQFNQASRYSWL